MGGSTQAHAGARAGVFGGGVCPRWCSPWCGHVYVFFLAGAAQVTVVDAKHLLLHLDEVKPAGVVNEAAQQVVPLCPRAGGGPGAAGRGG